MLDVYKDLIESNIDAEAQNDQIIEDNQLLKKEIKKYKLLIKQKKEMKCEQCEREIQEAKESAIKSQIKESYV